MLIQGLNYAAAWPSNVLDDRAFQDYGCRKSDAELYKNLIHDMLEFCDKSSLILAGYSQGAALTHRTIPLVDLQDRKRIRGIYLYGDTQKQKTRGGRVSEYPMERCLNICDAGDSFCERGISGAFLHVENPVTHEMYNKWSKPAAAWLVQQAKAGDWMMEDMLTDRRPRVYPPNQAGLDAIHGPWDSDDNPLGSRKAR